MRSASRESAVCVLLCGIWLALGPGSSCLGAVLLVPESYPTIQAAVDTASGTDTVSIAAGTYTGPGNRDIQIVGKSLLVLSREGPSQAEIDCQYAGRAFYMTGWGSSPILDGLRVVHGTGDFGGAVWAYLAAPVIRHCVFEANVGWHGGVGHFGVSASFSDCTFVSNQDTSAGGGAVFGLQGQLAFTRCLFAGNTSAGPGGAVRTDGAELAFTDCTITDNTSYEIGGAVFSFDANVTMERTICRGNWGPGSGREIAAHVSTVTLRCSDVPLSGVDAGQLVIEDVIDMDPLFCGPGWNDYTLRSDSPCLPDGNPCGVLIGAFGMGCLAPGAGACCLPDGSCVIASADVCGSMQGEYMGNGIDCDPDPCQPIPVVPMSWGRVKAEFR